MYRADEPWDLTAIGVDVSTAPVAVRERLGFTPAAAAALLERARAIRGLRELALVATCNRTELYLVSERHTDAEAALLRLVCDGAPLTADHGGCPLRYRGGEAAFAHLVRVACGLESAILGDVHIAGQLRTARRQAEAAETLGPVLQAAFRLAFETVRRARSETAIGRGHASLGAAVTHLIERADALARSTLIIGAGAAARDVGRYLAKRHVPLVFVNRTADAAVELAASCGGRALPWCALPEAIQQAQVVIAATGAAAPIAPAAWFGDGLPRLVIDLGVPRNIDPAVGALTIDEVRAGRDAALAAREAAVPAIEGIIAEAVHAWRGWVAARATERVIKRLFLDEAHTRAALIAEIQAAGLTTEPDALDRLLRRSTHRWLHRHVTQLRGGTTTAAAGLLGPLRQETMR